MKKDALITGGSRGIGRAIAIQLAKDGFNILLNYKSDDAAALESKRIIEESGGSCKLLKFDVSNTQEIEVNLKAPIESGELKVDVLVNNAGIRRDGAMVWMSDENWDDVIDINLNAFFRVTRTVLTGMVLRKNGRIINMVSLSGRVGLKGQTNYAAAKAGVIAATASLAKEMAKKRITVNAVAPGFIKTDMTAGLDEQELKSVIPMRRFGEPEEVANLVSFLASDKAAYITGEVVSISGGL